VVGPIVGAAGFVLAASLVPGLWGYAVGAAVFFAMLSDCRWDMASGKPRGDQAGP
jgi:hypothetical protein